MSNLSVAQLIAAGAPPTQARTFLEPLSFTCTRFDIDTPARIGAFVAQCLVESAHFTTLEEDLTYRTAERIRIVFPSRVLSLQQAAQFVRKPRELANLVYAGKNGNGNESSGDGWAYRGRGLIQLTGRTNYANAALGLSRPYLEKPELVGLPLDACLTAGWYWYTNRLNYLADAGLTDAITKAINGPAMREASLRRQYSEEAVRAFA